MWETLFGLCFYAVFSRLVNGNPCSGITGAVFHDRSPYLDSYCYWLINTVQFGNASNDLCKTQGGVLAVIPDQAAEDFIQNLVTPTGWNIFYIGVQDFKKNGLYQTYEDKHLLYSNWGPNEPNNHIEFECTREELKYDLATFQPIGYKWTDVKCGFAFNAVCSKTIPPAVVDQPQASFTAMDPFYLKRGNTIKTVADASVIQCAVACELAPGCQSYLISTSATPNCFLYNSDAVVAPFVADSTYYFKRM